MAMQQRSRPSAAASAQDPSILGVLDEGSLEKVLLAAKAAKVLGLLANSSRQLCSLARSRVPLRLRVFTAERAGLIIRSHACGRPPFIGCTALEVSAGDPVMCCLAQGVLQAAQQWTGLQQLELYLNADSWQDNHTREHCTSTLLGGVHALQQLRSLELDALGLGVCCAVQLQRLTQLTYLSIKAYRTPVDAAADLTPLSRLTNLVELRLDWALAPHLPAGPQGPFCLPSSLVTLHLRSFQHSSAAPMACWVAHLRGCPQLQDLHLMYGRKQHASVHPSALVPLLAQHHPQLRSLSMCSWPSTTWDAAVAGLPAAAAPVEARWQPDASLAALKGLQHLSGEEVLYIRQQADWQHLAQARALSTLGAVVISSVPELQAGSTLVLLELEDAEVEMGGYDVGRLLLACSLLQHASIVITGAAPLGAGARLPPHPALEVFSIRGCDGWGKSAVAADQFAGLAPVLGSVSDVDIMQWPLGSREEPLVMPDLSPCTALTSLAFEGNPRQRSREVPLEQEHILSMVGPLKQLQRLEVTNAPRVNARIALGLQLLLPQLQQLDLNDCGRLLPVAASSSDSSDSEEDELQAESQQEWRARQQVLQLLRAGLEVRVCGYADE